MATAGPRFFGFVIGGALPAATAADMLAAGWDQVGFNAATSPGRHGCRGGRRRLAQGAARHPGVRVGRIRHRRAGGEHRRARGRPGTTCWPRPAGTSRRRVCSAAPRLRVVAGAERHATVDRSLRLLGLGSDAVEPVRADANGAIDVEDLAARARRRRRRADDRVPAGRQREHRRVRRPAGRHRAGARARRLGARGRRVRVVGGGEPDAAPPGRRCRAGRLVGLRRAQVAQRAVRLGVRVLLAAPTCTRPRWRTPRPTWSARRRWRPRPRADFTAESSRRARGFAVWAALRELGRDGVADLVDRCCALARRFADRLARGRLRGGQRRRAQPGAGRLRRRCRAPTGSIDAVQRDGTCWMGGTTWHGRRYMRISVSNYSTTEADVDRSVAAVARIASAIE